MVGGWGKSKPYLSNLLRATGVSLYHCQSLDQSSRDELNFLPVGQRRRVFTLYAGQVASYTEVGSDCSDTEVTEQDLDAV